MFLLFTAASVAFSYKRLLRLLHYFQQEGYDIQRFVQWLVKQRAFDRRGTAVVLAAWAFSIFSPVAAFLGGGLALLLVACFEENPLKHGKIKLNMTPRAQRIFSLAAVLYLFCQIFAALFAGLFAALLLQAFLFQLLPLFLIFSTILLSFDEKRRQKQFVEEAKNCLKSVAPYVIGITGSYGKTSTKNALAQILQVCLGSTFSTSKSVNTAMGITREIRGHLKKGTQYAVMEMGAYGLGSIAKLCALTPPKAAIITTIGVAHLDRFGSQETIRKAKAELAAAVPRDGILVCNGDDRGARLIAEEHRKEKTYLYGFDPSIGTIDCWIKQCRSDFMGTEFVFAWQGKEYPGRTEILGRAGLSNLAACFTMACALGADPLLVIGAIANLKPVEQRLQIREQNGVTYLQDGYNSNPQGFSDALEVLASFPSGKKVLMTPGMIELGELASEMHEKIGKKAGKICDMTLIVGETNRKALESGLSAAGAGKEKILFVNNREEAFSLLNSLLHPGDAVLIENDLPDLYESQIRF